MSKQIKATGIELEEYEFVDKNGKYLYKIAFNPADLDIVKRYDAVNDWLDRATNEKEADTDTLFKLSDEVKEKIDYLLNAGVSSEIFSIMNPFTPLASGQLYVENVMENIANLIESELGTRMRKVQSRMDKYTAKYHK